MPLVAWSDLPSFAKLEEEGQTILSPERASNQYIRELHVGVLNMMPDAALSATERQFFRLVGNAAHIAQFYMHPFSLPGLPRGEEGLKHVDKYYESFEDIKSQGLDALIITGANVTHANLEDEDFWEPLTEVIDWAENNVTSILCSCLATHAMLQYKHGLVRQNMGKKRWGVFEHQVVDRNHPLVSGVNTRFEVPHSRFNDVSREAFESAGLQVLVESKEAGVHLAVSEDGFRVVYFQGHAEYDTISLLKEYKREVGRYARGEIEEFPPFPQHYFTLSVASIFNEYRERLDVALASGSEVPKFPEDLILSQIDNTWRDTGSAVVGYWIGLVYQLTNKDRQLPFMEGVDPDDPLGLVLVEGS